MSRPSHVADDVVCDFSVHRPSSTPFERYAELADRPLRWTDRSDGHWIALSERTVHEVLGDPARFSSECIIIPERARLWPRPLIPEELDPPEHATYRRFVAPFFSPPAIDAHRPALRSIAAAHVDALPLGEPVDLMAVLARPFATRTWSHVVGLTKDETAKLVDAHGGLSDPERQLDAAARLVAGLEAVVADRRSSPGDDVPSAVVGGVVDGRPISEAEALDFLFLLVLAGLDTVASVLGYTLRHLAGHPLLQERLADDPDCRPLAVEEALRRYSVVSTARTVTVDTTLDGVVLEAGDRILVPTCAASMDPTVHDDPLEFDVDRPAGRHLAFGAGPHRCLGSHLARAVLDVFLAALAPVRIEPDGDLSGCATGGLIHGMATLPATVRPASDTAGP